MPQVRVSAGPIDYRDTGGDKPVVVFLHGVLMDGHLFDFVVDALRAEYRCIVPTLPLGAHLHAMDPDADLSLRGFGRMVGEFLECLDLCDVTVVQNDHAAAIALARSPGTSGSACAQFLRGVRKLPAWTAWQKPRSARARSRGSLSSDATHAHSKAPPATGFTWVDDEEADSGPTH